MIPNIAIVPSMATKPNGMCEQQQRDHHADQSERRGQNDHERTAEALQLDHQQHQHGDQTATASAH